MLRAVKQVVPLLPPDGGDAVQGLGLAAPSHPLFPEAPEELVSQRAAQAEERLGHPANQRARELQRTVPAHARQSEWHFIRSPRTHKHARLVPARVLSACSRRSFSSTVPPRFNSKHFLLRKKEVEG